MILKQKNVNFMKNFINHLQSSAIICKFLSVIVLGLFAFTQFSFAQANVCGFPEIPVSEIIANRALFGNKPIGPAPRFAIWLYLLRGDQGESAHNIQEYEALIPILNGYFDGVVQYTICGTTTIDNELYREMDVYNEYSNLENYINTLNEPNSDHCIRVFISDLLTLGSEAPSGYAYSPTGSAASSSPGVFVSTNFPYVLGHELGHYFGLPHTFGNKPNQYVDDMVVIYSDTLTCYETGDGFCDTPADPQNCNFGTLDCQFISCPLTDPLGKSYTPDPTLLMSYYLACTNRFTPEQKSYMRGKIDGGVNSDFGFLYTAPTECLIPMGYLHRYCDFPNGSSIKYNVMTSVNVKIKESLSNFTCNKITGSAGEYNTVGCTFPNTSRQIIPDKNYGVAIAGVDVKDAESIINHVISLPGETTRFSSPFQMIAADVNNSGTITSWDAQLIRKLILGYISGFPAGNWRYLSEGWLSDPAFVTGLFDGNPFDAHVNQIFTTSSPLNYLATQGTIPNNDSWMDYIALNLINPIALNDPFWAFYGIKVGDVNCTLQGDDIKPIIQDSPTERSFNIPNGLDTYLSQNTSKHLQVIASISKPVSSWQIGIIYPSNQIEINQITNGNTGTAFDIENFGNHISVDNNQGDFRALWYSSNGTPLILNNKVLFELDIKALSNISKLENLFLLDSKNIACKFFESNGNEIEDVDLSINLVSSLDGIVPRENSTDSESFEFDIWPSPFQSKINVFSKVPKDTNIEIWLFDVMGKLVYNTKSKLIAGDNVVEITSLDMLPTGLYQYNVIADQIHQSGKLLKN